MLIHLFGKKSKFKVIIIVSVVVLVQLVLEGLLK